MNRNELRKAGELAGIMVDKYGYVLNDTARKRIAKMTKWKNTKGSKTNYVERVVKKWNISTIRVLSTKYWIGEYGMIYNEGTRYMKDKYIYSVLRTFYNEHTFQNWFKDEYNNYYYIPEGYVVVEDCLLKMKNGQYFDIESWYYFSMEESAALTKWLKGGYDYYNSQIFIDEYYSSLEE